MNLYATYQPLLMEALVYLLLLGIEIEEHLKKLNQISLGLFRGRLPLLNVREMTFILGLSYLYY